jgi:hypothetical protein
MVVAARVANDAPFPLDQFPRRIDDWKAAGDDMTMDTRTIQIVGCSDYVTRVYKDERTGVTLSVFVAYGPAEKLVNHTPAICYPAVGYQKEAGPDDRAIASEGVTSRLRSFVFIKRNALSEERLHVYAGFRHAGQWTPDSSGSRKRFRHEPGMFKIQVQRYLGKDERTDPGNPIEQFISALIPELDRSILGPQSAPQTPRKNRDAQPRPLGSGPETASVLDFTGSAGWIGRRISRANRPPTKPAITNMLPTNRARSKAGDTRTNRPIRVALRHGELGSESCGEESRFESMTRPSGNDVQTLGIAKVESPGSTLVIHEVVPKGREAVM